MVARKSAALSGDVRKAFQLCRAAIDLVLAEAKDGSRSEAISRRGYIVKISDVQRASSVKLDSPMLHAVATSTTYEALVLVALASLLNSSGHRFGAQFDLKCLLVKMRSIADSLGDASYQPVPRLNELLEMISRMGEVRDIH